MLAETITVIFFLAIFLFTLSVGAGLPAMITEEQIRSLRLIIYDAPPAATRQIPSTPEPLSRYLTCAPGDHTDPEHI